MQWNYFRRFHFLMEDASVYALIRNKSLWLDYFWGNLCKQFCIYAIVTTAAFYFRSDISLATVGSVTVSK